MEMNVFIVEDDEAIFESVKESLGKYGLKVSGPADFKDVVSSFVEEKPYLVIMDI